MAIFKPYPILTSRAALMACACLVSPLAVAQTPAGASLAERELARRNVATMEAQELILKGDESYQAGRFSDAVEAYAGARELLPDAPVTAELRDSVTERYVQASIEHAKHLSRKGDVPAARIAVEKVLAESVAPGHPAATQALAELHDPIRTNPALTAEHAADVDKVRRLLYTAEGAYNLGKFDQAEREYENALRIDPTNSAARRGMERVVAAKSSYQQSARDEARARMLGEVEAAWELQPTPLDVDPALLDTSSLGLALDLIPVANKLDRIILPSVQLEQVTLDEALELLRVRSAELDTLEPDPSKKGINFRVNLGDPSSEVAAGILARRFDLRLSQVPLSHVLRYLTDLTGTSYTTDDYSVIIRPAGSATDELVSRTYRVPPDFLSNLSTGAESSAASDDPFAEPSSSGGLLPRRLDITEALAQNGVSFPDGAVASLTSNTLRVKNTHLNQDIIEQLVNTIAQSEPVSIAVRVTMIKVQQSRLEELGFDWLLDDFGIIGGGDSLNLSGGTQGNGGSLADIPLATASTSRNPITAGNRSGDGIFGSDALDDLVRRNLEGRQEISRAPGIFGVNGYFNNTTAQMVMRGLDQKTGIDLMMHPSTVTRSGQASSIHLIREFIYPTEYEPPELPNAVGFVNGVDVGYDPSNIPITPATPTAFEKRDVGVILEVLPVADANRNYVDLTIKPQFVEFEGFVNYGSPIRYGAAVASDIDSPMRTQNAILMPVFSPMQLNTQVTLVDGATVVLGGLIQQRAQNVQDKTPVLGSIPVVGRMFQSKGVETVSTAIIFMVSVELLDPTGRPYRNR